MINLRWLIAHKPDYLFVRTAEAFQEELDKRCPNQFNIEILTMGKYIKKYGDIPELLYQPAPAAGLERSDDDPDVEMQNVPWLWVKPKWKAFFKGLKEQKFHISQTQITVIGGHLWKRFSLLDLPFLFKDHDHVTRALDGDIGKNLRSEFGEGTGIKSLAFTYSGGYRIIGSNHVINNLSDMKGEYLQTVYTTTKMFEKLGIHAKSKMAMDIKDTNDAVANNGAIETTYLRFDGTNILKTNHSMFLTSILMGEELFNELTPEQRIAFEEAAFAVGKIERKWSLEDCEKYEREAIENGVDIRDATSKDIDTLKKFSQVSLDSALKRDPGAAGLYNEIKNIA